MYEQKQRYNSDIKFFGLKIYERIDDIITIFDHEFADDEEEQSALAERESTVRKFIGIPLIKAQRGFDPDNLLPKEETNPKFKLPPINKLWKIILSILAALLIALSIFSAGIYTANTSWFNNTFYIKSRQMENLEIKSLKPYNKALFKDAYSQSEMNAASQARYEHYHKYYDKVVTKIREIYFEEPEREILKAYLDGYEQRKETMKYLLFPRIDNETEELGYEYGTVIGSSYPSAMLEFDRQELLTYRMILKNMYANYFVGDLDYIFEE